MYRFDFGFGVPCCAASVNACTAKAGAVRDFVSANKCSTGLLRISLPRATVLDLGQRKLQAHDVSPVFHRRGGPPRALAYHLRPRDQYRAALRGWRKPWIVRGGHDPAYRL